MPDGGWGNEDWDGILHSLQSTLWVYFLTQICYNDSCSYTHLQIIPSFGIKNPHINWGHENVTCFVDKKNINQIDYSHMVFKHAIIPFMPCFLKTGSAYFKILRCVLYKNMQKLWHMKILAYFVLQLDHMFSFFRINFESKWFLNSVKLSFKAKIIYIITVLVWFHMAILKNIQTD